MTRTPPPAKFYTAGAYDSSESVGYLMKRAVGSIVAQADRRLEAHGLTNAQWGPLLLLQKCGPLPVAELARRLFIDAGAMTRMLDRLEKKQLCKRVRSTGDRRVVQVELTPEGAAAITEVPAVLAAVLNAHLAGFSKTEWQALKGYLQRLADNGDALRPGPSNPPTGA
jgi:DNA-binding MarR family transcriptional regulator